jgi:hypothetical protein
VRLATGSLRRCQPPASRFTNRGIDAVFDLINMGDALFRDADILRESGIRTRPLRRLMRLLGNPL